MLVRLPVRLLQRVDREGTPGGSSSVFCPEKGRSTAVGVCEVCPRLARADGGAIECTPRACEHLEDDLRALASRLGSDACVGDAMGHVAVCIHAELPAHAVAEAMAREGATVAMVVDGDGRLVGLVEAASAAEVGPAVRASDLARVVAAVHESARLALAVDRMVHERARALPVVDDDDCVVALLTDLDALRWVARRSPV